MDINALADLNNSVYHEKIDSTAIRLLRVSRAPDGGFTGRLKVFRLSQTPAFYSASYTWGSRTYSQTSIRLKTGYLPVLRSLVPFLRMVTEHHEFNDDHWWWIDSLSINLADGQEREQQVRIMGSIYRKAKRAVVWLDGEVEEGSDCSGAIEFLHYLSELKPQFNHSQAIREELRSGRFANEWAAVGSLLARPWWTRVWTLQEFILPKEAKIFCGTSSISRGKFKAAMYSIFLCSTGPRDIEHELIPRLVFDAAFNRRRIHQWHVNPDSRGMNLVAIMAYLGNHSASDSRDRIFSVLGLITARDRKVAGTPEYTSSVQRLYAKLVRSFWEEYKSLDIICFSHLFNRYAAPMDPGPETVVPSYTPDWRIYSEFASPVPLMASQSASEHIGNFRPLHSNKWKAKYDAPGRQLHGRANIRFHENLKELWGDGVIIDFIGALGSLEGCQPRCRSFVCARDEPVHGLLQQSPASVGPPASDMVRLFDAIARSLALDRQDKYLRFVAPPHYVSDFLVLCNACLEEEEVDSSFQIWFEQNRYLEIGGYTLESIITTITSSRDPPLYASLPPPSLGQAPSAVYPPNTSADAESDDADTFLSRFQDTVRKKSRRLMVTTKGRVGMAPCRARLDDTVVVLFGCSIPLILRRVGVREEWQVIGEAYVHGFMNGEVSKSVKKGTRNVSRFRLV